MPSLSVSLSQTVYDAASKIARKEGKTVNQFVAECVADKVSP
jgi:predicted HicB family RNase H-like nuclease